MNTTFQARHYNTMARIIKESEENNESKEQLIARIVSEFKADNYRFSESRFMDAIYLHYHVMGGLHGCIPDSNTTFYNKQSAREHMKDMVSASRESGYKYSGSMKQDSYEEIGGNYYYSVEECREKECLIELEDSDIIAE